MDPTRRRSARLRLAFPVLVEAAGQMKRHTAEDVSEDGLLFRAHEPYHVGTKLLITFSLPATDVELVAEVTVRHVEWDTSESPAAFRVGVEFDTFDQGELHPPQRCLPS